MKLTLLPLLLLVFACQNPSEVKNKDQVVASMAATLKKQFPNVKTITVDELKQKSSDEYVLVDVRSKKEQDVSVIPGAITQEEYVKNLSQYKSKTLISYCTIGYRSSAFVKKMKDKGIDGLNLEGSILAWAATHGEFVDPKGNKTNKVHVYAEAWDFLPEDYVSIYE